jgi:hypothetical protein
MSVRHGAKCGFYEAVLRIAADKFIKCGDRVRDSQESDATTVAMTCSDLSDLSDSTIRIGSKKPNSFNI